MSLFWLRGFHSLLSFMAQYRHFFNPLGALYVQERITLFLRRYIPHVYFTNIGPYIGWELMIRAVKVFSLGYDDVQRPEGTPDGLDTMLSNVAKTYLEYVRQRRQLQRPDLSAVVCTHFYNHNKLLQIEVFFF